MVALYGFLGVLHDQYAGYAFSKSCSYPGNISCITFSPFLYYFPSTPSCFPEILAHKISA